MTTLQQYYDAVKAVLATGILATRVNDSVKMNGTAPVRDNYVVLSDESPRLADDRYTALERVDSRARHRFDVRSVATSTTGRRMYQDAVRTNLIGAVPVVEGRVCTPIQLVPPVEEGRPMFDSTSNLHYVTDSFEFWSQEEA